MEVSVAHVPNVVGCLSPSFYQYMIRLRHILEKRKKKHLHLDDVGYDDVDGSLPLDLLHIHALVCSSRHV